MERKYTYWIHGYAHPRMRPIVDRKEVNKYINRLKNNCNKMGRSKKLTFIGLTCIS